MNLHEQYLNQYPGRSVFNIKGELTKNYLAWVEQQRDPFLLMLEKKELEATEQLKEDSLNDHKTYQKMVKRHKKMKTDPSIRDIEKLGSQARVEAFLHPKEGKEV